MGRKTSQNNKKDIMIVRDISQGGLRMIDFEIMNKVLKIPWIKQITEHVLSCST